MTRIIPFLFICMAMNLQSQTYYISYDQKCLDRYEFVTDIDKTAYVVYASKVDNGKIIQFDVGKEEVAWVKNLPGKLTNCSLLSFDKAMALAINNSTVKMYMVRESPTHYNISKVEKTTFIESNGESLEVIMADADFVLDLGRMASNQNLATPASQKDVFLEGIVKYQCLTGYMFKKMNGEKSQSYKEYTIIPGVGIVNKRSLPYGGARVNSLRLDRVNDDTFVEHTSYVCSSMNTNSTSTLPAVTTDQPASELSNYGDLIDKKGVDSYDANSCGVIPKAGIHYVQKDETVYSISRQYGLSVDKIKNWNGIGSSNIISICQELKVVSPGELIGNNTKTTTVKGDAGQRNSSQFHLVKPNETVEQIAEMYGYTEFRFRTMNSLGQYERVYAGQKLYTSDCNCPNLDGLPEDAPMPYDEVIAEKLTTSGNPDVFFRPIKVHLVKPNETLFGIARQYDTTVDRIRELNGLEKKVELNKDQRIYVQ